jgi:CRP/FNR family transcriptional regulator, cyclic AMP receptor protein
MATSLAALAPPQRLEDPLAYLTCSNVLEYAKDKVIYGPDQPSTSLYLVIGGKVKVQRIKDHWGEVLVDIYCTDEFFGDSALIESPDINEKAVALEDKTTVMVWTGAVVEDFIMRRPRLGIALVQMLTQRCIHFSRRIESLASDNIERRLARTLIHFSERLGCAMGDGSFEMMPLTHELLSQYVGTSREIITCYMNQFRRQGYLRYSRKSIVLYPDAIKKTLSS